MKVLISAYACTPGRGSEPGAGWAFALAAARDHEVWVLTRRKNLEEITNFLQRENMVGRIHPIEVELPTWVMRLKKGSVATALYYAAWQAKVARLSRKLHRSVEFDVMHHVTFASDWMPVGITAVPGVPLIWGPVGGSTLTAWALWRWLGARGLALDVLRIAATVPARLTFGTAIARRASLVVAQNDDVATQFKRFGPTVVRPNVILQPLENGSDRRSDPPTVMFVGRLVAWKGVRLVAAVIGHPLLRDWRLEMYGDGPESKWLRRFAERNGLTHRMTLYGQRPRADVLEALQRADVFLFPSTHDSAPWAVGEALMAGCPVVCLDRGGPPRLLRQQGGIVVPASGAVVEALARGVLDAAALGRVDVKWDSETLADEITSWYDSVVDPERSRRSSIGGSELS
jgi:glycosyltransferase involved in cell wall biosynthesis